MWPIRECSEAFSNVDINDDPVKKSTLRQMERLGLPMMTFEWASQEVGKLKFELETRFAVAVALSFSSRANEGEGEREIAGEDWLALPAIKMNMVVRSEKGRF